MARKANRRLRELDRRADSGSAPPPFSGDPTHPDEVGMSWSAFVAGSIVMVIVLTGLAVAFGVRSVEGNLEERSRLALGANDYLDVESSASGNDMSLRGTIRADQSPEEAENIVAALSGVRSVVTDLSVLNPVTGEEVEVIGNPIAIAWTEDSVVVSGDVSDEATASFVHAAAAAEFSQVDTTGMQVVTGVADESDWLGHAFALLASVREEIPEGELIVNPSAAIIIVSGEVESRQTRRDLRDTSEELVLSLGFRYRDAITLAEEPPPPPEQQVEELQENLDDLIEGKVVEFEVARAVITPVGIALLNEILAALRQFPDVPVEIAGHADAQGTEARNLDLSERRALAVFDYLVSQGEDPSRFEVVGYGETRPIADNSTPEGRQKNRRIEFIALLE